MAESHAVSLDQPAGQEHQHQHQPGINSGRDRSAGEQVQHPPDRLLTAPPAGTGQASPFRNWQTGQVIIGPAS
jgi:hypothetical protein